MEGNTITLQEIRELFADTKGKSWEIAEIIYKECINGNHFSNQQDMADYFNVSKSTISLYKHAYLYYWEHKEDIDIDKVSVGQVFYLYNRIKDELKEFLEWLDEKDYSLARMTDKETDEKIDMYFREKILLEQKKREEKARIVLRERLQQEMDIITWEEIFLIEKYRKLKHEQKEIISSLFKSWEVN